MTKLACALVLGAGIAACVPPAAAVNLNPNGLGQVLIYPYYTVNAHQQTLVSVVNTTLVGKVVKVRFREAYNGRSVLDFNLYLSPYDVWTANVFALSDAGIGSDFAAIFSTDYSCTDPALIATGTLGNGYGYQRFANDNYTGAAADTGPVTDARTREGHIEMILMSDVVPGSELYRDITHVNGVPQGCLPSQLGSATTPFGLENASGYAAPTENPASGAAGTLADGGLFGAASIVNVAQGVFYAYNADALNGFSYVSLYTHPGDPQPTLASVNDRNSAQTATAHVFANGESFSATFPGTTPGSRAVDAVSAVFAANSLLNEYVSSSNGSIGTDWVVTFPTKHLYVDAQPGGPIAGTSAVLAPFEHLFGAPVAGQSCITTDPGRLTIADREEEVFVPGTCDFGECPPQPSNAKLCLETNVLGISVSALSVLGSPQVSHDTTIQPAGAGGWISWDMAQPGHQLYPASNGNVFQGLPLTGFAATRFVNNFIPMSGGGFAVASYSGAYHHRLSVACINNGSDACK